jgi:hypothetical protein
MAGTPGRVCDRRCLLAVLLDDDSDTPALRWRDVDLSAPACFLIVVTAVSRFGMSDDLRGFMLAMMALIVVTTGVAGTRVCARVVERVVVWSL